MFSRDGMIYRNDFEMSKRKGARRETMRERKMEREGGRGQIEPMVIFMIV